MEKISTMKDLTRILKESDDKFPNVDVIGICRGLVYFRASSGTGDRTMRYSCFLELEDKKYLPIRDSPHDDLEELRILKLSSEINKKVLLYGHLQRDQSSEKPYLNCGDIRWAPEE